MDKLMPKPKNTDEYIASFPAAVQKKLAEIRAAIKKAAPQATETISYGMPAFMQDGMLVYFAAFKNHIGFFPTASGVANFTKEITQYNTSKGTIQFPLSEPLPVDLIKKIVAFRVNENVSKAAAKAKKKSERICPNGHTYYKSSDCPVCPICEKNKKSNDGAFYKLSAPAQRALAAKGIKSLKDVTKYRESELLSLHGLGPSTIKLLRPLLKAAGYTFKK